MSDSTLEKNIEAILNDVEWRYSKRKISQTEAKAALLSLYQKELDERVHEEVGRILFKLPLEARKYLEPYLQAALTKLTGEQP